jgi:hypothetical protein
MNCRIFNPCLSEQNGHLEAGGFIICQGFQDWYSILQTEVAFAEAGRHGEVRS